MSGEQQTQEKMVPMSVIEQACRDVFLDKTISTVANELHGNMPGIAYYAVWRRCHQAAVSVTTKAQIEAAVREVTIGEIKTDLYAERIAKLVTAILFPEEGPSIESATGGSPS